MASKEEPVFTVMDQKDKELEAQAQETRHIGTDPFTSIKNQYPEIGPLSTHEKINAIILVSFPTFFFVLALIIMGVYGPR